MTFARAAALPKGFGRTVLRRAGTNTRSRSWRQISRRGYASGHGHGEQQSSEIPWMVGSAVVFFPSAAWLLGQGPTKSDHGHDAHHEKAEEESSEEKEEEQPQEEEPKEEEPKEDESKDEPKEESEGESKSEGEEKSGDASEKSEEDEYEAPGPNAPKQINWDSSSKKGPGEGQKGERAPSQKKGEKDAQGDFSGAKHPYLDDAEKSKKGIGVTETAKIHGTVDSRTGARGVGATGSGSS